MSEAASHRSLAGPKRNRVALLVGIGLVSALGTIVLQVACSNSKQAPTGGGATPGILAAPGDEPPIRVKGGSIDLQQMGADVSENGWDSVDETTKKWKVRSGVKFNDDLGLAILNSGSCKPVYSGVKVVSFTYTFNGTPVRDAVTIQSTNKKTIVSSVENLAHDKRLIQFREKERGYISSMTVDGTSCDLGSNPTIVVLDWGR